MIAFVMFIDDGVRDNTDDKVCDVPMILFRSGGGERGSHNEWGDALSCLGRVCVRERERVCLCA